MNSGELLSATFDRFIKFMPETDEMIVVILKGHLLIEAELGEALDRRLPNSGALKPLRLGLRGRFHMFRAMVGDDAMQADAWKAIELLNEIRNKLSHHLEPYVDEKIWELVSLGSKLANSGGDGRPIAQRVSGTIVYLACLIAFVGTDAGIETARTV